MSGVQLAEYAKRKFPHLKVILVSGKEPVLPAPRHYISFEALSREATAGRCSQLEACGEMCA